MAKKAKKDVAPAVVVDEKSGPESERATISHNGIDYDFESLPQQAKMMVGFINEVDSRVNRMNENITNLYREKTILEAARNGFTLEFEKIVNQAE